mmetsp:Transcript_30283/g.61751  ORF Transcript_30283/g.61751 Transcript_30283/m.61751 type:complete len:99 (-) Transcript_30283:54-350(-)
MRLQREPALLLVCGHPFLLDLCVKETLISSLLAATPTPTADSEISLFVGDFQQAKPIPTKLSSNSAAVTVVYPEIGFKVWPRYVQNVEEDYNLKWIHK